MRSVILLLLVSAVASAAAPTFTEDVAPLVFQNCTSCHRPGQAGPFPLTNYEEVKKRGPFLVALTEARIMPPWHAEPGDVEFAGARRLSDEQIALLKSWVEAGMPEGDPDKLPALPEFAEGWELGEPDLTLAMDKEFEIPAEGEDLYEYFVMDIPLTEAKWVRAIEYQPGARAVVHHILGFLVDGEALERKKGKGLGGLTGDRNRVLTWAIGTDPRVLPEGVGVRVEPGMKMVIQAHFHPTGKVERELSHIGLFFSDEADLRTTTEIQVPAHFGEWSGIEVPAGSDKYTLRESFTIPVDVKAFATFAHAHYIGKAFELTAHQPDGKSLTILKIDNYDFAWQELYKLSDPLVLPAGTRLDAVIRWDNRATNPANPYSPPQDIRWGPFSEDEMGSIILDSIAVNPADEPKLLEALEEHAALSAANFYLTTGGKFFDGRSDPGDRPKKAAKKVLDRFDADGNGELSEAEKQAAREFLAAHGFDKGYERASDD
ncbi:MAG: hypothetical protein GC160_07120 [Acidobacteria bacterium]|nr:hypothetical protein [Acidobacteriota bacterium]